MNFKVTDLEELKKVLKDHEKRLKKLEGRVQHATATPANKTRKSKTKKELLVELEKMGFFKEPKGLGEMVKKLAEKAYTVSFSDLTPALRDLVRDDVLERVKKDSKWVYKSR